MDLNSEQRIVNNVQQESNMNFMDLILVLSRHVRLVFGLTLATLLISSYVTFSKPKTYMSRAKFMVLEFVDQTRILHVGNDGKLVLEKKHGYWRPADISLIKGIVESSKLKSSVANLLLEKDIKYSLNVLKEDKVGSVFVTNGSQETSTKAALTIIQEAGRQAFRLGILSSPALFVDSVPNESDGATFIIQLLEVPTQGEEVKPRIVKAILLPTLMGFCFSAFVVLILDYFQNLTGAERSKFSMIKSALSGKNDSDTKSTTLLDG